MKIAFLTCCDILNSQNWRTNTIGLFGTHYYKSKSLNERGLSIEYIIPKGKEFLIEKWIFKAKKYLYKNLLTKVYYSWAEPVVCKRDTTQISQKLSETNPDIVVCTDINLIAYIEYQKPIVLWITNLFTGLVDIGFYEGFTNLCAETVQHLKSIDRLALDKCSLAIFPSEWAAKTALETFQANPSKIKVIPYGANIECNRRIDDIQAIVNARYSDKCKLLFLGVDWVRKGGEVALAVATKLNEMGLNTELTIVGCKPFEAQLIPNFVVNPGFISKSTEAGLNQLNNLIAESHFLILPSRSETYGNVLCEANSFGVPCLATNVGGIPTIIKENLNGKIFSLDANITEYCTYILDLFNNYSEYKKLAISSFNEYQTRLNWSVVGETVQNLFRELTE